MKEDDTKTLNGDSKYYVTPEEAQKLMAETTACSVLVVDPKEVAPKGVQVSHKDVVAINVEQQHAIKDGIMPQDQEAPFRAVEAAEMNENGVVIVVKDGRAQQAQKLPEDPTQRASREGLERRISASEKYEQNNNPENPNSER